MILRTSLGIRGVTIGVMRTSRSAIVRSARTSPGEETKTRMVFIMLRNGEGPLDPVPETALIHRSAKPLRSSASDTRKFEAVDARRSRIPNDVNHSLRLGSDSEHFTDLQQ